MELSFCDQGQEVLIVWVAKPLNFLEQEMTMREVTEALRRTTRPLDLPSPRSEKPWYKPPTDWKPPL
jgi:hypothetical protein